MYRKAIVIFLFSIVQQHVQAQDISRLIDLIFKANDLNDAKKYDSTILIIKEAEQLIEKSKLQKEMQSTVLYNLAGSTWQLKQDFNKAHHYFSLAINAATKYNFEYEGQLALGSLVNLHRIIKEKDLPFSYPVVKETEMTTIMFAINKITSNGDSLDITIHSGKHDGITDSIQLIDIYTHPIQGDTTHHTGLDFISNGRIVYLSNNRCIVRTQVSNVPVLVNDVAFIKAAIPASWRALKLRKMLLSNLYLVGNQKEFLYDYRYFYYYADSSIEKHSFAGMYEAIKEVARVYAADTIGNSPLGKKIQSGIFQGYNVISGMIKSTPSNIALFLNYVNRYPLRYIGNNFKLSETYGTWMIGNTPLAPVDVKPYLLSFINNKNFKTEIAKLSEQISTDNLTDMWLDDGMQQVGVENINEANNTATLLQETFAVLKDDKNAGWANYIKANTQKKLYNNTVSDSLLNNAKLQFKKAGNEEGLKWVNNSAELWQKNINVNAGIQNGHLFSYNIAQSYNPRFFATGGSDNLIKIWDRNLGKEIVTLTQHEDRINALSYSSNGRYLASAGQDREINIYNAYNYGLIYSIKTSKAERALQFSPDNEFLTTAGTDSLIKIRDFKKDSVVKTLALHKGTVNDICYHPLYSTTLFSAGADSLVYKWDVTTGDMLRWYKLKGKVLSVKISSDGQYMSTVSNDSLISIWNLSNNRKTASYYLSVFKEGLNRYFASETFSPDGKYLAFPTAKDSFAIIRLRDNYQRIYATNQPYNYLADLQFSKDGLSMFARFTMGGPLRLYNFVNWDIEFNTTINWKDIKSFANMLIGVQFIADDNKLAILHSGTSKVDLRNGKTEHVSLGGIPIEVRGMFLNDEKKAVTFSETEPSFSIYEYASKKYSLPYSLPIQETIASFEISGDNKYAFSGGHFGYIAGWNIETGEQLFGKEYAELNRKRIAKIIYDKYRQQILALTDSSIFLIDINDGKIVAQLTIPDVSYAVSAKASLYAGDLNGNLYTYELPSLKLLGKNALNAFQNPLYQLVLSEDEKKLFVRNNYTDLTAVELSSGKILYTIRDHDYEGTMLALSKNGKLLASAGFDSKVKLYEAATGKAVADVYIPMERDAVIIDPAGYYLAPKNSLDAMLFSFNNNAFTYEQFDARFNRPDLILKRTGKSDTATLNNYYSAYKKRLSKLQISDEAAQKSLQVPFVRLIDKYALQTITTEKEFEINIECRDNLYDLKSLQVLVNNNPVLGINGRDLSTKKSKTSTEKVKIRLSTGSNNIKVFCTNTKGARSLNEQLEIFAKYNDSIEPKTYFIGIAVADYKDSSMNLQYSAKDVRDLAACFDRFYPNLVIDTLINENATKENILALRKKLAASNVNDRVILAVTGHGLLSKSFDFYYATWDNDFSKPETRGIKYDELENLLTDIPARRKLMLIDACHSGALDKEELLSQQTTIQQADSNSLVTGTLTRGVIKINKNKTAGNSFEMMQKLFTDLKGNNGAVIISAAGGMEYALESARWNNGVFTYCVRKGIEEKLADKDGGNFDGKVSVQELQQYVSRKVSELTAGKQQPTNRSENLDFEWWLRN